jgi:iron complex transport system permease protein
VHGVLSRKHSLLTPRHTLVVLASLSLVFVAVFVAGMTVGSVSIPFSHVVRGLIGSESVSLTERTILLDIRLPRLLLASLVGAGLSAAGVVFQALLRNPLAEPYILGISSGGTVGAILSIGLGLGLSRFTTPVFSFLGSAAVMFLVYTLAHRRGQLDTYMLLLAGVMVGAFFNAVILLIVALYNQELRNAFLWLMGNLSAASMESIIVVGPFVLLATAVMFLQSRNLNLIATGDETAMQLGVEVPRVRRLSYLLASLVTGLVVSVSGVIGFVGLIIPHVCRMLFGPDHRLLMPASFLLGASFLIVADILSRLLLAPTEIPVGAVTAALGAPFFIYLLRKT